MQLHELLEKKTPHLKGLCDDLFLLMVEFVYRHCAVGWENEKKEGLGLSSLDVKINDKNALELFSYWCGLFFNAYNSDFIKMMLEAKYDYLMKNCVDFSDIIRIKYLKSLLTMPQLFVLGDFKEKIKAILYNSIPLISSDACNSCLEKINGSDV